MGIRKLLAAGALAVASFSTAFTAGTLQADAATVTHHHRPNITVRAEVFRGRPMVTVTVRHMPACAEWPVVVAQLPNGRYLLWGYNGTIRAGRHVSMTLELRPGTHVTLHVIEIDSTPCGNPDGQYAWTVHRTVRI